MFSLFLRILYETNRAYLLIEGTVFRHGTPEELAADVEVRTKYLGDDFELR